MKVFTQRRPWYAGGLAFECQQCGRCCSGPDEGYVWVVEEEIREIAAYLGISDSPMRKYVRRVSGRYSLREQPGSRDCVFLDGGGQADNGDRRCLIYPVRPAQCRTWPFWPSNLTCPEAWSAAGQRCIGINRGSLVDYNEIEARRLGTSE